MFFIVYSSDIQDVSERTRGVNDETLPCTVQLLAKVDM